jgi:hypothetical protein
MSYHMMILCEFMSIIFSDKQAVILIKKMFPNIRPKIDLQNTKDILQLKFVIIAYVNCLEWRKYIAVWFVSIQERINPPNAKHSNFFC